MPWQTLSLNSPYLWQLNVPSAKLCHLFNIRYVVAPPTLRPPKFYRPLLTTSRYKLYEVDSGGYFDLGQIDKVLPAPPARELYARNLDWIASDKPAEGRFIAFPSAGMGELAARSKPALSGEGASQPGAVEHEVVTPDSFSAQVTASSPLLLVLKVTYHPNWHVIVDGREQPAFMVSPSFIGTMITPGRHEVKAEYRSSDLKKLLLILSCATLVATIGVGAFSLEPLLFGRLFG
jgi:Bacterial membrane protein YfhO